MFEQSFLPGGSGHRRWAILGAFAGQSLFALGVAAIPLLYVREAPKAKLAGLLLTPPAPPPLQRSPRVLHLPRRTEQTLAPRQAPFRAPLTDETPAPERVPEPVAGEPVKPAPRRFDAALLDASRAAPVSATILDDPGVPLSCERAGGIGGAADGELDGVAGGVPGGTPGGVIGGIPGGLPGPPVPQDLPPLRIQLSRLERARLIHQVIPEYPMAARQARVEGVVHIRAIIGIDGKVRDVEVVDGHPLLRNAAASAVRKWRYEPMKLNGKPVEAKADIAVKFRLVDAR
ncbi:MAG: energy transducer TonB [bacterium]|jgi:protein TonB